jgi:hypothetical protein
MRVAIEITQTRIWLIPSGKGACGVVARRYHLTQNHRRCTSRQPSGLLDRDQRVSGPKGAHSPDVGKQEGLLFTGKSTISSPYSSLLEAPGPSINGFGPYQNRRAALGSVAHLERVSICKVGRDVAVIADRNEWARLSQMDVVSVVFEAMRKQTRSGISSARHSGKQHGVPPKGRKISLILRMARLYL